jgi:hypothetical protein
MTGSFDSYVPSVRIVVSIAARLVGVAPSGRDRYDWRDFRLLARPLDGGAARSSSRAALS